ncbi:hypothetical protein M9Y10_001056 [Tritrichomonas musculus]|uniref:Uncharacterized protein n=1 Tax=Tritrichomonas musculus TaxID=1915356 RepID=A0ABR2L5Y2_9EUKA
MSQSETEAEGDISEIKEKLRQMRAENRLVATENRKLIAQIQQIDLDTEILKKNAIDQSNQLSIALHKTIKQIENEVSQRVSARKERKVQILTGIRQKTEENKILSAQVKALENEILRIRQIQETYSSNIVKRKLKQTRKVLPPNA